MQKKIRLLKENLYSGHSDYKQGDEYFWCCIQMFCEEKNAFSKWS